jgi:hypothetical protein
MIVPITVEGAMGDYPSLQSIQGVDQLLHPQYTFGASYVVDPLVWLIPQALGREGLSSFSKWTDSLTNVLEDKFAPTGGFYYVSEAVAALSYVGPAIITIIYAAALIWVEKNKNHHRLLYLSWMSTLGLLFIKTQFGNCVKLFLIQILSLYVLLGISKLNFLLPKKKLAFSNTAFAAKRM